MDTFIDVGLIGFSPRAVSARMYFFDNKCDPCSKEEYVWACYDEFDKDGHMCYTHPYIRVTEEKLRPEPYDQELIEERQEKIKRASGKERTDWELLLGKYISSLKDLGYHVDI